MEKAPAADVVVVRTGSGAAAWAPGIPGLRREARSEAEAMRLATIALREYEVRSGRRRMRGLRAAS